MQVAVVATARKLTVLCWHLIIKGEDYAYAQPSLVAHKRRKLELRAGLPSAPRPKGKAAGYSLQAVRAAERDLAAQAERAYRITVAAWQPTRPAARTTARKKGAAQIGVDVAATTGARLSKALSGQRGAAGLTAPHPALRDGVEPRPPPPNATPVLTGVKVVVLAALRALHLDPGCGPATSGCAAGEQKMGPTTTRDQRRGLTISSVV